MKYVLDENGNIKIGSDGHPMVVDDAGKEYSINAIGAQQKITELSSEAKGYRKKASERKTKLAAYEGIEDPAAAIQALQTVSSMGEDHKIEIETLKGAITKGFQAKLDEKDATIEGLNNDLYKANVTTKFATSKVVETTFLPPDIAASTFGKHFQSDGTAKDASGNVIYAKENPGEPAGFEEALAIIIDQYPNKDDILRGSNSAGPGTTKNQQEQNRSVEKTSTEKIKSGLGDLTQ